MLGLGAGFFGAILDWIVYKLLTVGREVISEREALASFNRDGQGLTKLF
jgi:hypothetical protein